MLMKRLRQLAYLGVFGLGCVGGASQAQDWYTQHGGQFPTQYYGHLQGTEMVYLYSPQYGWRCLPVVRNGVLPGQYGPPAGTVPSYPPPVCTNCPPSMPPPGYRSFWVPLKDVALYQNDPRFRVVTPQPKPAPVAPAVPPKP
ncbi:MAG: hypothetical protein ACKV2Q_10140 [Planctomycetaceae bacterium]